MHLQQAVFTSSSRGPIRGYHIVGKSRGIDESLEQTLFRWSPSQMSSNDPANWTINCYPASQQYTAVSRTVLGGPEYSSRGGVQVVTIIALLDQHQFSVYQNNAMLVAQSALALGWFRFPMDLDQQELATMELPDAPFIAEPSLQSVAKRQGESKAGEEHAAAPSSAVNADEDSARALAEQAAEVVEQGKRVAIIGQQNPRRVAEFLISNLSVDSRSRFSFTTGLPLASHRPFQAQFLQHADALTRRAMQAEGFHLL